MRSFSIVSAALCALLLIPVISAGQQKSGWQKFTINATDCNPVTVAVYVPKSFNEKEPRAMVLLHSWGKSSAEWEKNPITVKPAEETGTILICPDMGKTVYESEFYQETTVRWNGIPGIKWTTQILIPWIQKDRGLFRDKKYSGIAGLEIGARGALLTAAALPDVIGFAGGISGMYDSGSATRYDPFIYAYGRYKDNKERWENSDSIITTAPQLANTVVFIAHGKKETRPGIDQSHFVLIRLSQLKKKAGAGFQYKFSEKPWGEGWTVWGPSLVELFKEFESVAAQKKD